MRNSGARESAPKKRQRTGGGRPALAAEERELLLEITHEFVAQVEALTRPQGISSAELGRHLILRRAGNAKRTDAGYARDWGVFRGSPNATRRMTREGLLYAWSVAAKRYGWRDDKGLMHQIDMPAATLQALAEEARQFHMQHEAELAEQLAVIADELAQRYQWTKARLVAKIRDALAELGAHEAVQSARVRAIKSELPPPEEGEGGQE